MMTLDEDTGRQENNTAVIFIVRLSPPRYPLVFGLISTKPTTTVAVKLRYFAAMDCFALYGFAKYYEGS